MGPPSPGPRSASALADRSHRLPAARRVGGVRSGGDHPRAQDRAPQPGHRVGPVPRGGRSAEHRHDLRHPAAAGHVRAAQHHPDLADHQHRLRRPGRSVPDHPGVPDQRRRGAAGGDAGRRAGTSTVRRWSSCPPTSPRARRGPVRARPTTPSTTSRPSEPSAGRRTASTWPVSSAYSSKQGQPGRTVTMDRTWCPGRGLVAATETFADLVTRTTQTSSPPPRTPSTTGTPLRWTAPESWTEHPLGTISIRSRPSARRR